MQQSQLVARIEREQAERKRQRQSGPADIAPVLAKRRKVIKNPDSESERSDGSSGCSTDEGESKRKETKQKKRAKRKKNPHPQTLSQIVKQEAKVPTMIIYLVIMKIGMQAKELSCSHLQALN